MGVDESLPVQTDCLRVSNHWSYVDNRTDAVDRLLFLTNINKAGPGGFMGLGDLVSPGSFIINPCLDFMQILFSPGCEQPLRDNDISRVPSIMENQGKSGRKRPFTMGRQSTQFCMHRSFTLDE